LISGAERRSLASLVRFAALTEMFDDLDLGAETLRSFRHLVERSHRGETVGARS
jgi:hypothetical protein